MVLPKAAGWAAQSTIAMVCCDQQSAGRSFFLTEVRIADTEGRDCPCDEAGERVIRGDRLMVGYWRRLEATAEALHDGWLSSGEKLYLAEIEPVLLAQSGTEDVAAIAKPSEQRGVSPAVLVVAQGLSEHQVIDGCRQRLAAHKMPVMVTFIDHIPRNSSGRILKRVLRER